MAPNSILNTSPAQAAASMMPASSLKAVSPGAGDLPDGVCRALMITAEGTLTVQAEDDSSAVALGTWPAGSIIPVRAIKVTAAAATVVAMY